MVMRKALNSKLKEVIVGWHQLQDHVVFATEFLHLSAEKLFRAVEAQSAWHASYLGDPERKIVY